MTLPFKAPFTFPFTPSDVELGTHPRLRAWGRGSRYASSQLLRPLPP
jgi:hypothetical protein